ncbi:DEAD/DEAH box helicase [Schleiferia thermophila str. Yellowstone]|uniref:type I restriction endonuclease subunit R n=1 Tax=Schleiferia thermophila TaxID=884107 RepID=UPI0004E6168F|nr:type I restriction endonuclease subunit R [Schleiferia thermophila]KFD40036.1 DEAD/DEAH box helicase [Schleiferia thermophila str. Yellowstone]
MPNEQQIENSLIIKLTDLKYTHRADIRDRASLEKNFREKFQALNRVNLTDSEFDRLLKEIINPDVFVSSKRLREINTFTREDGTPLHYTLVNIKDWCKNEFEVINQLRINTSNSYHRYDVILLINGIPVVQIELKSLEVSPRKAMQQIVDYKSDPGNGYTNSLLCFMQLFIVSNRVNTYYFANNNTEHFKFNADEQFLPVYQFAEPDNKKITHLDDFSEKFLSKCTLSQMISKYMVLVASEQKLMVMRPYQIYAVKAIVNSIQEHKGNGYIWHTTGSGKTLTSFKASTLLKDNPNIEKCLFVVDRKDLDRQTREEFNKFQEGCVEENTNTETLVRRMLSEDYANKVIVTTIQKLGLALDPNNKNNYKERLEPLRNKRIVFIFDECHRSQFGENHKAIKEFFPKAQLFGFTGTPIFEDNATYKQIDGTIGSYVTTKDIFQNLLHNYTITHAIEDKNVLRFHIDYFKPEKNVTIGSTDHKKAVVNAILKKHDAATNNRRFNAILATASINDAIEYYELFVETFHAMSLQDSEFTPLNIACVFSPPAEGNKDVQQLQEDLQQEKADNKIEPEKKKKALEAIISDYNKQYGTNFSISEFDLYYQDVQQRIKFQKFSNADYPRKNKIDLVIVVDMLLTGFDSKYLNTLYVDKNLKYHGLIQAFSRTNRVLNDTKPYGNILDFRQQQAEVDRAIALFSGESVAERAKEIWLVDPAPKVIEKYQEAVKAMEKWMEDKNMVAEPQEVYNIKGDVARIEFINRFKEVQRLKTQLDQYTDLTEEQKATIEQLMPEEQLRSFRSSYLEIAKQLKEIQQKEGNKAPENIQQLDFEFVLFASAVVDYDYIMNLIAKYTQTTPKKQKMTREQLIGVLSSSANLMEERNDIIEYINSLQVGKALNEQEVKNGYQKFKEEKIAATLAEIAQNNGLEYEALKQFTDAVISRMIFDADKLSDLFAHLDLSWKERSKRELALMEDLVPILRKKAEGREISGLKAYE